MRTLFHFSLFFVALATMSTASAQKGKRHKHTNVSHHVDDRHDKHVRHGKHRYDVRPQSDANYARFQDDKRDLREIVELNRKWHSAVTSRYRYRRASVNHALDRWLDGELRESRREVQQARHELRRRYRSHARNKAARRNLRQAERDLARTRQLAHELRSLRLSRHYAVRGQYARKSQVLDELVHISRNELSRSRAELHGRDYARAPRPYMVPTWRNARHVR